MSRSLPGELTPLLAPLLLGSMVLAGCRSGYAGAPVSPPPTGAITVGRTAVDPVTGDALTVQDVDRDGVELLVEVTATAGMRFATGVRPAAVTLRTAAGTVVAAGTPPVSFSPFMGAQSGRRASGWLAFTTPAATGSALALSRAAFTVVGSQQTVPAATFEVPLPAA